MALLTRSLETIRQDRQMAVKIVMSKSFFEDLSKLIPFTRNTGSYVNMIHGIPLEVIDDPSAPDYSIEYEYSSRRDW